MRRAVVLALLALALGPTAAAVAQAPAPRLDVLAEQLRETRLAIDDDVVYLLDEAQRRQLRRQLAGMRVPVFVALLPALEEDESGGDQARQLRGLYDRVGEPGVYVVANERGQLELADAEVPLRLSLDFGLLGGGSTDGDPSTTLAPRLAELLDVVAAAPAGAPGAFEATIRARPLPALNVRQDAELAPMAVLAVVGGLLGGAVLFGLTLLAAARIRRRA